jgi:tetratricopeptide (TPR) repeat protein
MIGEYFPMTAMKHIFTFFLFPMLATSLVRGASIEATLSSQFLVRGEQAVLEVMLSEVSPPEEMRIPSIPGVTIQSRGFGGPNATILPGRKLGYIYQFALSSFEKGRYTIPPVSLKVGTETISSNALNFEVFDGTDISFSELRLGNETIRYAAFFKTAKKQLYEGESMPVELKIYFPANQRIEEWGIPDFDRDGITAWRFEPRPQLGGAILLGANYQAASYPSILAAGRSGKVTLGPAKIRLISVQNAIGQFGTFEQNAVALNLTASALELESKALPPNPPEGFSNAIGTFTLSASSSETEVREGDPVNVDLTVSGRGNLDSMDAPVLADDEGWKLYEATRSELGEARRLQRGQVFFKQFMRPISRQTIIPPFQLAYFDPALGEYKVVSTAPIPLKILPSTNPVATVGAPPPQAANLPVERMTDILGLIKTDRILNSAAFTALPHLWHLVPAILLLTLCFAIFHRHFWPRFVPHPELVKRRQAWSELEKAPVDAAGFFRCAGHFIEANLAAQAQNHAVAEILKERDQVCFLPNSSNTPIDSKRRNRILKALRKLAFALVVFAVSANSFVSAEDVKPSAADATTLYNEGKFKEAIGQWLGAGPYKQLSAETLYNIGNACYRAGSQGHAALYYRRALLADPSLDEARQNLRFIERKFGALTIKRPDYQYSLTRIPRVWLTNTLAGIIWLVALSLLTFPATRSGSKLRFAAFTAILFSPLLLLASALALQYYPNDSAFAPYEEQAVIVADKAVAYADASRSSGHVIDAPAGSLCRIIRRSDRWVYIAFASQTRGWVPAESIEPLIPTTPPQVPSFAPPTEPKQPSA